MTHVFEQVYSSQWFEQKLALVDIHIAQGNQLHKQLDYSVYPAQKTETQARLEYHFRLAFQHLFSLQDFLTEDGRQVVYHQRLQDWSRLQAIVENNDQNRKVFKTSC